MIYTPFDKELSELDEEELNKLITNEICEGWYVEFKSEIPRKETKIDSKSIVKAISAFANTRGGWLFFGVNADKSNNIANEICGIDIGEYKSFHDQLSTIISKNITPQPIFHLKEVKLNNGKCVIIIKIEEGVTPPYITNSGIIFQRENSSSSPIKDRYVIEKLNEKANEYYESIENFTKINYGETQLQSQSDQSYLELYLFPLPYDQFEIKKFFTSQFFKETAVKFYDGVDLNYTFDNNSEIIPLNIGFYSIYTSENSLIIRPLNDNNLIYKTTTAELFYNGNLKFLIPLNVFNLESIPYHYKDSEIIKYLLDKYSPYETIRQSAPFGMSSKTELPPITRRKNTDFASHITMIDGVELIFRMIIIYSIYKSILNENDFDINNQIGFRARITNPWRKFIFFDNNDYLDKLKVFNIPIAPKNDVEVPLFRKGNYYEIDLSDDMSHMTISHFILKSIGLPDSSSIKYEDIVHEAISRLYEKQKRNTKK